MKKHSRDLFIEKSIEGNGSSTNKQAQAVYRNKNGQFTSSPDASTSKKTVRICESSHFLIYLSLDLDISEEKNDRSNESSFANSKKSNIKSTI